MAGYSGDHIPDPSSDDMDSSANSSRFRYSVIAKEIDSMFHKTLYVSIDTDNTNSTDFSTNIHQYAI